MTTVGGVEAQLEREARQGRERESERRLCSDLYRPRGAGQGTTPKRGVVTRIRYSVWPRPPARHGHDSRKPQHSISSKRTPRHKNVLLRPHDTIRIAHTELRAMNRPVRTPRPCPDDRPRTVSVPRACSVCAAVPELHNMPSPDRSPDGHRGEKTLAVHGRQRGPKVRCYGEPMHRQ